MTEKHPQLQKRIGSFLDSHSAGMQFQVWTDQKGDSKSWENHWKSLANSLHFPGESPGWRSDFEPCVAPVMPAVRRAKVFRLTWRSCVAWQSWPPAKTCAFFFNSKQNCTLSFLRTIVSNLKVLLLLYNRNSLLIDTLRIGFYELLSFWGLITSL